MLDLNLVRVFVAVYRHSSYTLAARELNLTQPAISQAIRRFEESLDSKLFINEGRRIIPTPNAMRLIKSLSKAIDTIEGVVASKRDISAYVNEAIFHLLSDVEHLQVKLQPKKHSEALADLQTNKIELLLDTVSNPGGSYVAEELIKLPMVVVCKQEHPRVCVNTLTKELFYQEEHVVAQYCNGKRQLLESYIKEPVEQTKDKFEVNSVASLLLTISKSDCIGVVNAAVAQEWAPVLGLEVLPLPFKAEPVPVHMIYHQKYVSDQHHQMVRDIVKHRIINRFKPSFDSSSWG